ncbi:MAG: hypothetical protein WB783_00760 [Arenicellales bacterium]|jgi:ElaB/YqjD/DUF883 family membrane-anchored ribosome-binding protein
MANRDINQDVDQLREDLNKLREDVSSLVDTMRKDGAARGRAAYESARESVDAARETLGREIEERPVTSILTAFGVGFVVGLLLDRRH